MRSTHILRYKLVLLLATLACNMPSSWISSIAPGGTWYVDKTGNDSNDCLSATSACLTITAAVSKALTGGVIQIGPGIFEEVSPDDPDIGLHINGKVLTFRGTTGTIIGGAHARTTIAVRGSAVLIFEDLIIQDGGGSAGIGLKIEGSVGAPAGATLTNVIIQSNAQDGLLINGPAAVTLDNVQVLNNGRNGVLLGPAQLTIKNSTLSGNAGDAINNTVTGTMVISDTTISNNGSTFAGAAVVNAGELRIERSTVSGTTPATSGPIPGGVGIWNKGTLSLVNSTVAANSAAGIRTDDNLKIAFSTVAENGDYGINIGGGSVQAAQNIIENNSTQDCYALRSGSITTFGFYYVNLSDGSCGASIFITTSRAASDPYLGHLADNGGPTQTMALLLGSAAINGANEYTLPAPPAYDLDLEPASTDQRGDARPAADGGIADVGAYEFQLASAALPLVIASPETPTIEATKEGIIVLASPTETPAGVTLSLDKNANCRTGPSTVFPVLTSVLQGQTVQLSARNDENTWWFTVLPGNNPCWISMVAGHPTGDTNQLPVKEGPPTPIPTTEVIQCSQYADPSSCTSNGCTWDKQKNSCH